MYDNLSVEILMSLPPVEPRPEAVGSVEPPLIWEESTPTLHILKQDGQELVAISIDVSQGRWMVMDLRQKPYINININIIADVRFDEVDDAKEFASGLLTSSKTELV